MEVNKTVLIVFMSLWFKWINFTLLMTYTQDTINKTYIVSTHFYSKHF